MQGKMGIIRCPCLSCRLNSADVEGEWRHFQETRFHSRETRTAVKDDGGGGNAGAGALSEQSPPEAVKLDGTSSEQSPPEAEETHSSSDPAPKIGIVEELSASKDGVHYVLENARVFTWPKPLILGNLTVEHYTTILSTSRGRDTWVLAHPRCTNNSAQSNSTSAIVPSQKTCSATSSAWEFCGWRRAP